MSFLDAFQGYHQIALAFEDKEKTSFITPEENYHYTVMLLGKECKGYLSANGHPYVQGFDQENSGGLH